MRLPNTASPACRPSGYRLGVLAALGGPRAGGTALARYLLDHPDLVAGRPVLDLAAGSGLVAIAAIKAGAIAFTAVEIDPLAATAIELNAAANSVDVPVRPELESVTTRTVTIYRINPRGAATRP